MTLRRFAALAAVSLAALAATTSAAHAASTCAAQSLGVSALQSNVFYIDVDQSYLGSYVGYKLTNSGGTAKSGLWMQLEDFTGGVLKPGEGTTATAPLSLGGIGGGGATSAYAYLNAASATTAQQGFDVVVYSGRPGSGGTEVCRETQSVTAVEDVIKAAANKVDGASLSSASATLGSTFNLTVSGHTGTIGAGTAADPGVVRFSLAVAAAWPSRPSPPGRTAPAPRSR